MELALLPDGLVAIRDSKLPAGAGAVLVFTREEMAAFVGAVKNGEFDDLL